MSGPSPQRQLNPWITVLLAFVVAIWASLVGYGTWTLAQYENSPGELDIQLSHWPNDSEIPRSEITPTLVMFVHPHCPCSRASLAELARTMTQCQGKLTATVVFIRPQEFAAGWEKTDLWYLAESIPNVSLHADEHGKETERFAAKTSGHSFLFSVAGDLLFSGGMTPSRGHEGGNNGKLFVESYALTGSVIGTSNPVYGCGLLND